MAVFVPAMHTSSDRFIAAGWLIRKVSPDLWELTAVDGTRYPLAAGTTPSPEALQHLQRDEDEIAAGTYSPFAGTCRLSCPPLEGLPSPLAAGIADRHLSRNASILRLCAQPDPAGDALLAARGAWRVETLLPPWRPRNNSPVTPFSLILCDHLLDSLPRSDRLRIARLIREQLLKDGAAYFSLYDISGMPPPESRTPFEDGYCVRYGRAAAFLRPYTAATAQREILHLLPGLLHPVWTRHHEHVYEWRPD